MTPFNAANQAPVSGTQISSFLQASANVKTAKESGGRLYIKIDGNQVTTTTKRSEKASTKEIAALINTMITKKDNFQAGEASALHKFVAELRDSKLNPKGFRATIKSMFSIQTQRDIKSLQAIITKTSPMALEEIAKNSNYFNIDEIQKGVEKRIQDLYKAPHTN